MKYANFKKMLAVAMAATMMCTPVAVFATEVDQGTDGSTTANGNISGEGGVQDYIDKDVFRVVLPTVSDVDFTLDPQGLLNVADSASFSVSEGAIYFANTTDDGTTYSSTSDAIEIINKSSYAVDVTFSVNVTLPEGVEMVETEDELANATVPSVYLAMQEAADDEVTVLTTGDNAYEVVEVAGVPEVNGDTITSGYEIKKTGDSIDDYAFTYGLTDGFDDTTAEKASYTLTGACDSVADWSSVKDSSVAVAIVWSAQKHVDAPTAANDMSTAAKSTVINGLADGVTLSAVKVVKSDNSEVALTSGTQYTFANNTFAIVTGKEVLLDASLYKQFVLTFSDSSVVTINIVAVEATE